MEALLVKLVISTGNVIEATKFSFDREAGYDLDTQMTFDEMVYTLNPELLCFVLRKGIEDGVAPELVQEVWIKFWTKFGDEIPGNSDISEENKTKYTKWIYTTARNLRTDKLRQVATRSEHDLRVARESRQHEEPEGLEGTTCLEEVLGAMGERCVTILELKALKWKNPEIAEYVGLAATAIGTTIARCRSEARQLRQEFCPDLPMGEMA